VLSDASACSWVPSRPPRASAACDSGAAGGRRCDGVELLLPASTQRGSLCRGARAKMRTQHLRPRRLPERATLSWCRARRRARRSGAPSRDRPLARNAPVGYRMGSTARLQRWPGDWSRRRSALVPGLGVWQDSRQKQCTLRGLVEIRHRRIRSLEGRPVMSGSAWGAPWIQTADETRTLIN
jgi:hypothetical protein